MFGILLLLFTVIPALELYLLFAIGGEIGGMNTILVIIVTGILGAGLAKSQGLKILQDIQSKASQGELPEDQIIQGLMVFAGGLLLLTPGFMTDIFGFSLVLPGTRHLLTIFVKRLVHRFIKSGNFKFQGFSMGTSSQEGNSYSYNSTSFSSPKEESLPEGVIEAEFTEKES
jgi:UPF0716 protein FxsA